MNFLDAASVLYVGFALIGFAVFVVSKMVIDEAQSRAAQENLDDLGVRKEQSFVLNLLRPLYMQYVLPLVKNRPGLEKQRIQFKRKILAAGLRDDFTPDTFLALKFSLIMVVPVFLLCLRGLSVIEELDPLYVLFAAPIGFFGPDLWIQDVIQRRQKKIMLSMPFVVDLLALSTEAGLDFVGAIAKVVDKSKPSPLIEEFSQLLKEMRVGASRQEALREMGGRIDLSAVNSFIAILISADQMGASIGKVLRQQSDQIRTERLMRAEKAGARAAQLIMLPMVLFIIPAVFLMIFGPFLLDSLYGSGAGGGLGL
jgi:tight adherence protein C